MKKASYREEYLEDQTADLERFDEFLDAIACALDHQPEGVRDNENRQRALLIVDRLRCMTTDGYGT